ncbi:MAG: DUF2357 domain-containing protein [Thiocapsa sp. C3-sup]|uniref:DUF2357 domain-containing protein n=1 Tax=unclassified Thiocapsa TaxID=2641286 RepID=UPI0035B0054F
MRVLPDTSVPFRSPSGAVVAYVTLMPVKDAESASTAPLAETDEEDAREHGETTVQLRESERYEYEVVPANGADLRLRCSLSSRRRSLGSGVGKPDAGLIETRSFCGTLLLELVEGEVDSVKAAVATALLDVRSLKLDYRTEYRGMLRRLSDEIAGLVADARSSAKAGFRSTFEDRTDAGWLQIQLELLRETLDSSDFSAALQRILSFPHERLSTVSDSVSTDRPIRWTPSAVRQLVTGNPRREVPTSHPLRSQLGLESVAERVLVPRKSRDLDTLENRFVKFALGEFRAFLTHAQGVFESCAGWGASAALSRRLAATVEDWLGRSLFREVGEMRFAPLGSPVLQRKAGYREVLRWWLRFRTAAELSWEGGEALFHAGQRDVASLYEYWLFFELLGWFCQKCRGGNRPSVEELIEGLEEGSPNLRLRKRMELGPFVGTFAGQSRRLNARFAYNRRFEVTQDRHAGGSWTRRLHPDYTLTFWPEDLSEADAERQELLVHVHFDAKYRVEDIEGLFGAEGADDADDEVEGNYKRQDLLKMHAYRDAIKRSQGAYVLYPGRANAAVKLKGFHEILPGLGAFGVAPDENGMAQGLEALEKFLDEVLAHLGNRTTAQERVSYHIAESYTLKEEPVQYGSLVLAERDELSDTTRALPPSEHHVVVAWYNTPEQLAWTLEKGIANVRLGNRPGTWHIPPEMASARHVLLRTHSGKVAPGLFRLTKPGYKVYSANDLTAKGYPGATGGEIYAVFEVEPDAAYAGRKWDEPEVTKQIKAFESRRSYRQVNTLHRRSPDPRVLSLQELLRAMR